MSWSVSATGTDGQTTIADLHDKLTASTYCPPETADAIVRAAALMAIAMTQPVKAASSSGHIGDDGKGYANLTINAT